jgi:uncharacterized iron-regulated protein
VAAIRHLITLATFCFVLSAQAQIELPAAWESSLYSDHPMVGRIWDSKLDQFIGVEELLGKIESARYLLLGEKHDNPDHHLLQLTLLEYFLQQQRVSNVAFEMLNSDQAPLLQQLQTQQIANLDELKSALEWDDEGWDWPFYGPMLYLVQQAGIPIAAANISDDTMMRVYAEPASAEISAVLDQAAMTQLDKDIDESHCGLLPQSQFPAMVRVQQTRDNSLAQSLPPAAADRLSILIAGNYHIRHDLSVPNYLLSQQAETGREQIVSLAFMEVDPSENSPEPYLQQFGERKAYDFIWFTPSISDEDYCASLQQ